jgi:predicted transcriptional regulator
MTDLDYDSWFIQQVEKGQAQADRGELIDHEEAVKRIEKRFQDKQSAAFQR